ncbi:MAG: sortase [Actinomycetota bacterium]|nr:sortase [Actinomycetota bacterium]
MRRNVQILGWTLIWSGLFIFGSLGWQLFGTDLVTAGVQREAQDELVGNLEDVREELPDVEQVDLSEYLGDAGEVVGDELPEQVLNHPEEAAETGEAFGFMRIPKVGLDQVIFAGVDTQTLKQGPGHMERTPLPGQVGNAVISGHRTTYGRPFFDFDLLEVGDEIEVETAIGTHIYAIREILIVEPTDVWVTDPRAGAWLTLTTCDPKFSARKRLIVIAEMIDGPNLEFAKLHKERFGEDS